MSLTPEKIFLPSVGCDLIINDTSVSHRVLSTIIYEADFSGKTITIAQPNGVFASDTKFNRLHLTTIISTEKRKYRVGISCKPKAFLDSYQLAGKSKVRAVVLSFEMPIIEVNIRAAFRLILDGRHTVRAKLVYQKNDFFSPDYFRVKDISITGVGLLIPRKVYHGANPLLAAKLNDTLAMGMQLVDTVAPLLKGPLAMAGRIQRVVYDYSQTSSLLAVKFLVIDPQQENILSEFIHMAQIQQLNRFSSS